MFQRVSQLLGFGVLKHHGAVLVVKVGEGKGLGRKVVEELLLGVAVVGHGLMVVEMVVGEVGEDASGELQAGDAVLVDSV